MLTLGEKGNTSAKRQGKQNAKEYEEFQAVAARQRDETNYRVETVNEEQKPEKQPSSMILVKLVNGSTDEETVLAAWSRFASGNTMSLSQAKKFLLKAYEANAEQREVQADTKNASKAIDAFVQESIEGSLSYVEFRAFLRSELKNCLAELE